MSVPDAEHEKAVQTVLLILRNAKIEIVGAMAGMPELREKSMPAAIRALHKSGFSRTSQPIAGFTKGWLSLRRMNIGLAVQLPEVVFGADTLVERTRKSATLCFVIEVLTAGVVDRLVSADKEIDVSYNAMMEIYREKEKLNAWRNHMQFVLPADPEVTQLVGLLDRYLDNRQTGAAVDYDLFDIRWSNRTSPPYARLQYVPSGNHFELEVGTGDFLYKVSGARFEYLAAVSDLMESVEAFIAERGDTGQYRWTLSGLSEVIRSYVPNRES